MSVLSKALKPDRGWGCSLWGAGLLGDLGVTGSLGLLSGPLAALPLLILKGLETDLFYLLSRIFLYKVGFWYFQLGPFTPF